MRRLSRWLARGAAVRCRRPRLRDDVERKLAAYEAEARQIGDQPAASRTRSRSATGQRRLVDAEVAFALGDYDAAALMLFDLASKPGADQEHRAVLPRRVAVPEGRQGRGAHVLRAGHRASNAAEQVLPAVADAARRDRDRPERRQHDRRAARRARRDPRRHAAARGRRTCGASRRSRRTSYDDAIALLRRGPEGLELRAARPRTTPATALRREEGPRRARPRCSPT